MSGYQPKIGHPVWWDGVNVNTFDPATGVGVRVTGISGWIGGGEIRDVREARYGQDGEYADNLYLGGKSRTIEGEIIDVSWDDVQDAFAALAEAFTPSVDEVLLKVPKHDTASPAVVYADEMTGYERVSARVIDPIIPGDAAGPGVLRWQVVVRSSDPRVYNDVATSANSGTSGTAARTVAADQAGAYPTPTVLEVSGPTGSDWSIAEPTSGLVVPVTGLALASTENARIDTLERLIEMRSGYSRLALTTRPTPTALWMLDESSGTVADNAEGTAARDGTYTGGFTLGATGPLTGMKAVDLNGSTGYISLPNQSALYPATSAWWAAEIWVNFDSLSGTRTIIDGITSNKGWGLSWNGSNFVYSRGTGSAVATHNLTNYATIATGAWYRIIIYQQDYDGISRRVTIRISTASNAPVAQTTISGLATQGTSGGYRLGASLASANFLDGKLAAFTLYNDSPTSGTSKALVDTPIAPGSWTSVYQYLDAANARWAMLGKAASTFSLASSGLATGSKLNVSYRDARL